MNFEKILNLLFIGSTQSLIKAKEETKKCLERFKMESDNVRSIDNTIGYLIDNDIHFDYKGKTHVKQKTLR